MLKAKEIVEATKGILLNGDNETEILDYKIDSRQIEKGDFYIPILGENVDGHKFITQCVDKGCSGFFISNLEVINLEEIMQYNKNIVIIQVKDTKQALVDIGIYNRKKHIDIDVVAITGSVGKTSTREMIASVLSQNKNLLVTQKNMNSYIGMPLMDLKFNNQDLAILEAGIDFVGEMDILNKLLIPDVAIITNIGTSHIEKLGSQEIIYNEKTNISKGLKGKKILLLNGDDKYLSKYKNPNVNIQYYSLKEASNISITEKVIEYDTLIYNNIEHIVINAMGNHNILNSLAAIKVAQIYGLSTEDIKKGILNYNNYSRRMEKINLDNILIIDDTYNASPSSTKSGLISINEIQNKRRIAVLADILELGNYSKDLHQDLGEFFENVDFEIIIAYGQDIKYLIESAKKFVKNIYYCNSAEEAEKVLRRVMKENDVIYFKGSNAMKVNQIIENLKRDFVN